MRFDPDLSLFQQENKELRNYLERWHGSDLRALVDEFPKATDVLGPMQAGLSDVETNEQATIKLLDITLPRMKEDLVGLVHERQAQVKSGRGFAFWYEVATLAGSSLTIGGFLVRDQVDGASSIMVLGGVWTFLTGSFALYQRMIVNPNLNAATGTLDKAMPLYGRIELLLNQWELCKSGLGTLSVQAILTTAEPLAAEVSQFLLGEGKKR